MQNVFHSTTNQNSTSNYEPYFNRLDIGSNDFTYGLRIEDFAKSGPKNKLKPDLFELNVKVTYV